MRLLILTVAAALAATACGDPNALSDPQSANFVDTLTVSALTGTDIQQASAVSLPGPRTVRTDLSADFDFAFDIEDGTPVLLPRKAMNFPNSGTVEPGLQAQTASFDQITEAISNGYTTLDTIPIAEGDRFLARSRVVCSTLGVPIYGKIEILTIDTGARTLTFRVLADQNCGYVGLQPGLPNK